MFIAFALIGAAVLAEESAPAPTPAERAIAQARAAIAKDPRRAEAYNSLAMALARRARETADPANYAEAEAALETSFELDPDNFEGLKVRTWVLLGKHEFAEALKLAQALNKRMPDDEMVYGLLVDAHVELGNYEEAEEAAQWMLDLTRGSVPALARGAYLRELFGDLEGAIDLMESAYRRVSPLESEERAWLLTQVANLRLCRGQAEIAEALLDEALRLFPAYHYALAGLARARAAQGKHAEAADLLRRRYERAPHPENLYDLAVALDRAGKTAEASAAFAEFAGKARAEMDGWDNANRELAFYYVDKARDPAEALRVTSLERSRRRDVFTRDVHAWALSASGRHEEARKEIDAALAVGIRDAKLLYHAGVISWKLGDHAGARARLQQALELNPRSEVAEEAERLLRALR
jgi:tetratricopeptide (TPR) repeat protein